jgi:hypothetical protein
MANVQVIISALNRASSEIAKVKKDIEGVGKAGKESEGGLKTFGSGISSAWKVSLAATAAITSVALAIKEVQDAAKEGAAFQRMEDASASLARSLDADMSEIMDALREASLGMVSDFDLMQAASRAMMLGVSADSEQLAQLMEVAALRGRAMGISTTQAFNDIVTGIGRASPMILDNLGIVVDAEGKYQDYAEALGKTAEELTKQEKTQALLNGVLESSKGLLEETGGLTIDNAGKWEQMSAAQKNYFDLVKSDIADATSWWAEYWAAVFNERADVKRTRDLWEEAQNLGIITAELQAAYDAALRGGQGDYKFMIDNMEAITILVEDYNKSMQAAAEGTDKWAAANYEGEEAARLATAAIQNNNVELERMTKLQEEISKVTSLTGYFSDMVSLGENFTDILAEITVQEQIMAENPIGSEKYEEAKGKVEELKVAMQDLANQVVLDMMMSTIAIGGVTQAEADAYFQLAADMGSISQEAAEAAKAAYGDAIEYINSLEIDDKTGNIVFKVDDTEVRNYHPPTIRGTVAYIPAYATTQAVGGAVQGGAPYTWQEYGYRGELFVPSADGFIMSRADAERALSKALAGGASKESINADDIGRAIADALVRAGVNKNGNVYNLTMPTSSNPADVKTAFELMEAWA